MRRLVVAVVLVVAVLVGLDRGSAYALSLAASHQAQHRAGGDAHVHLLGFPFLTQVARGDLSHVTLHQTDLDASVLTIDSLTADAHGVHVSFADALRGKVTSVPVDRVTGSATVSFASLTQAVDSRLGPVTKAVTVSFSAHSANEITARVSGPLGLSASQTVPVPSVTGGELNLGPLIRAVSSLVPGAAADAANIPLPPLPYGLRLQRAQAEPDGLHLTVTGRNVSLPTGS